MKKDLSYKTGSFWGLTIQKGPWKETSKDRERLDFISRKAGGGIGVLENTSNANGKIVINPFVVVATNPALVQPTPISKPEYLFKKQQEIPVKGKRISPSLGMQKYRVIKLGKIQKEDQVEEEENENFYDRESNIMRWVDDLEIDQPLQLLPPSSLKRKNQEEDDEQEKKKIKILPFIEEGDKKRIAPKRKKTKQSEPSNVKRKK